MNALFASSVITLLVSCILSACATWLILRLADRLPWMSRPSLNRLHVGPTPVWGGVAIFLGFFSSCLLGGFFHNKEAVAIAIAAVGVFLLGLADDIWKLKPSWKLSGQIVFALIPLAFVFTHRLTGYKALDFPLAFLWLIGITNAFNLIDNINGLSAGTAVLVSSFQAVLFFIQGEPVRALASIAFGGAILGFLIFNFPRGRIFMGDSGSLFIGFWLAATTLMGTKFPLKNHFGAYLFPLLVMVVPICDTTLVTLTRILKGRPVSVGGTDHLSHRLMAYGFSGNSSVLVLWALSLFSGVLAILGVSYGLLPFLSIVTLLLVGVALFGVYLTRFELHQHSASNQETTRHFKIGPWFRISLRVLLDIVLIVAAYYTAYQIRFDGVIGPNDMNLLLSTIPPLILIKLAVFVVLGAYRPWWEYFGLKDAYKVAGASVLASLISIAYFSAAYRFNGFSRIVVALDFLVFTLLMLVFRFSFRLFNELAPGNHRTNVLICGADSEGETALKLVSKHYRFRVVGFLDDDHRKRDFSIHSVPIRGCTRDLVQLARQWDARVVLLTPSTSEETKAALQVLCNNFGIKLMRLRLELEDCNGLAPHPSSNGDGVKSEVPENVPEPAEKILVKVEHA